MNQQDIEELRKLAEAATPGKWYLKRNRASQHVRATDGTYVFQVEADGEFIAAANPTKIIELLDTIKEQRRLLERTRDEMEASGGWEGDDNLFSTITKHLEQTK